MADVQYQSPMQLMELLGLRGWEASQPRVYWGLRRPDDLPAGWASPNAGLGGMGTPSWGYQGGYGTTTGGGGGYNSAGVFNGGGFTSPVAARSSFSFSPESGPAQSDLGAQSQTPGSGLGAQSASLGDWLGSFTSPIGALTGLVGQIGYNAITGNPNAPITSLSLASLVGGGDQFGGTGTLGSPGNPGPGNPSTPGLGDGDNPFSSGGSYDGGGYQGGSNDTHGAQADAQGPGNEGGMYARGGIVTPGMLTGPNPPGPDDGMAYLDIGEGILSTPEMAKIGGPRGFMQLRDLIRRL